MVCTYFCDEHHTAVASSGQMSEIQAVEQALIAEVSRYQWRIVELDGMNIQDSGALNSPAF